MCGIFGVINGDTVRSDNLRKLVRDMALAGAVRGVDGLGIYQVKSLEDTQLWVSKTAVPTHHMLDEGKLSGYIADVTESMVSIGHHRHATVGKISDQAAQPFFSYREDGTYLVGVHNGTLNTWNQKEGDREFHSDSDWAIHQLSKDYDHALTHQIRGAYAFVTYDSAEPTKLRIALNGQRDLAFAFVKGRNTMLIASEAEMLAWLCKRNKIELEGDYVYEGQADKIYTFDTAKLIQYTEKPIVRVYPPAAPTSQDNYWSRGNHHHRAPRGPVRRTNKEFEDEVKLLIRRSIKSAKAKEPLDFRPSEDEVRRNRVERAIAEAKRVSRQQQGQPNQNPTTGGTVTPQNTTVTSKTASPSSSTLRIRADEAKALKGVGYDIGVTGMYYAMVYDKNVNALHGNVMIQDKGGEVNIFDAMIRDVTPLRAEALIEWCKSSDVRTKVIGMYTIERVDGKGVNAVMVCAQPDSEEIVRIAKERNAQREPSEMT
jgi:predicted glutamine amidotransferase